MSETPLPRLTAALQGRYAIEGELGSGGMATVYLADDVKHERKVAIKVLKPELAAVIGAERFVTEIKTTANLQHPHILPLFDSGEADGFLYYVMPYIEGESLRDRLGHERQLPVEEAVRIAAAVASALDYAHRHDVIHRDIKPENILLHEGNPVVADFGIALAVSAAGGGRMTETGLSLGTPHYMSPEQATADRDLSARSDVYSLSCVLYEMLAGDPPHTGPTAQSILMRILTEEPRSITDVRKSVPPHVAATLAKGMEKLPADRFESAEAFGRALADDAYTYVTRRVSQATAAVSAPGGSGSAPARADGISLGGALPWAVAAIAVVVALLPGGGPAPFAAPTHRYALKPDSVTANQAFAISMDGSLVYNGAGGQAAGLFVRRGGQTRSELLAGTEGGFHPTFSPDGEWIAFAADGELRKIPTDGGPVVTLARDPVSIKPDWGPNGTIVFWAPGGLYTVPDIGGEPQEIMASPSPFALRWPTFLPDGEAVLFTSFGSGNDVSGAAVQLLELASGEVTTLFSEGTYARWVPTGHLVYGHASGALFAVPFDLSSRSLTGPPVPVVDQVAMNGGGLAFFEMSQTGSAVYQVGGGGPGGGTSHFVLVDMEGRAEELPLEASDHFDAAFSPDGRRIAYIRDLQVYIYDMDVGTNTRLTFEGENHHDPEWSPDGERIAFSSMRGDSTGNDIFVKRVDGTQPADRVTGLPGPDYPEAWTSDGLLLFQNSHETRATDLHIVDMNSPGSESTPYLRADWTEARPDVSSDGKWVIYQSNQSGQGEVYVRGFPEPSGRWQISDDGGSFGRWAPDGSAVYYRRGRQIVAVDVQTEPTFQALGRRIIGEWPGEMSDISPDGTHLLIGGPPASGGGATVAGEAPAAIQHLVVANWFTELRARLGEGR